MKIIRAGLTLGPPSGAAPADVKYFVHGLSSDLSNEISLDPDDATSIADEVRFLFASAAVSALELIVTGDTDVRAYYADDGIGLGGGSAAVDAILTRSAANTFLFASGDLVRFGGGARLDASQTLRFRNPVDTFQTTVRAGAQTADATWLLPIIQPTSAKKVLQMGKTSTGQLTWGIDAVNGDPGFDLSDDAFVIAMATAL